MGLNSDKTSKVFVLITLNQPMWLPNSAYTGSEFKFKHACAELQS